VKGNPGLVLGPGPEGWWDSERCSSPQVLREADGSWKMWYYGRDPGFDRQINFPAGRSGLATSADGITWERARGPLTMGAVIEPSPDPSRFDSGHVGVTNVQKFDDLYWMWYLGGDQSLVGRGAMHYKGLRMLPGCAISRNGLHWSRVVGPYHGALLEPGPEGAFDSLLCNWPRVLRDDDGTWKLYYHSRNPSGGATVGLAISTDGLSWEKVGPIFGDGKPEHWDGGGPGCRQVLKVNGQYLMFYEGRSLAGYYCIGLAISNDGIHWERDPEGEQPGGPVFCHAPTGSGRWDARAVGTPWVVPMDDGSFRLYYVGVNEGGHDELSSRHQIGMAVSDGPNFRSWRRYDEE
jgi:predicted GH43/DUF377 family glycosyl hydrolase